MFIPPRRKSTAIIAATLGLPFIAAGPLKRWRFVPTVERKPRQPKNCQFLMDARNVTGPINKTQKRTGYVVNFAAMKCSVGTCHPAPVKTKNL
jgi:hypothetical protein